MEPEASLLVVTHALSRTRIATVLAGVSALALYTFTLAPDVGSVDSGELTLAAWDLGVPHPPGFPLYVLLAHVASLVPIGSIAVRVNFASALFAAIAAAAIFRLTLSILNDVHARRNAIAKQPGQTRRPVEATVGFQTSGAEWPALCGALTSALLFMCLRTTWAYATVAEVYALSACLTVSIFQLMLRPSVARGRLAAVLFGLAVGAHPPIVIAMLPALALLVSRSHGIGFFATRQFAMLFVFATIGAAVYLYLPFAALRSPVLNWGDPATPERLWAHVSGLHYRGEALEITPAGFMAALRRAGTIMAQQSGQYPLFPLLLIAVGAAYTFRHSRPVFWALAAWMTTNVLLTTSMNAGWAGDRALELAASIDLDAYYIPTLIASCVFAGVGAAALLKAGLREARPALRVAAAGMVAALAVLQPLASNWPINDRSRDRVSRNYVDDVLQSIAVDGMLLMRDWNLSSPMMYVQQAEGIRSDVAALDLNLMERRWYAESVARRHPAVFASSQEELSAFLNLGGRWQRDPRSIQRDPAYHAALNGALDRLLLKIVDLQLQRAPAYVTFDVVVGEGGKQDSLATKLAARFQLVPQGLVYQLVPESGFHDPAPLTLRVPPLLDFVRRVGPDHLVSQRIATVYRDMLISRGVYLEANGRCPQALAAFGQALSIDSTSPAAAAVRARCNGNARPAPSP